jgi:hypothetical protein
MPPVRFEPTIPVSERPKTHAFDRAATGIGEEGTVANKNHIYVYITVKSR